MKATTGMLLITKICFQFFVFSFLLTTFTYSNIFEYPCSIGKHSRNDIFSIKNFLNFLKKQAGQAIMLIFSHFCKNVSSVACI